MKTTIAKKVRAVALVPVMAAGVIGGFAKIAVALAVTSVYPEKGPMSGGQEVTAYGDFTVQGSGVAQMAAVNPTPAP